MTRRQLAVVQQHSHEFKTITDNQYQIYPTLTRSAPFDPHYLALQLAVQLSHFSAAFNEGGLQRVTARYRLLSFRARA